MNPDIDLDQPISVPCPTCDALEGRGCVGLIPTLYHNERQMLFLRRKPWKALDDEKRKIDREKQRQWRANERRMGRR